MELNPEVVACFKLAVQTALYRHRDKLHWIDDPAKSRRLVEQLSEDIMNKAGMFRHVTENVVRELEIKPFLPKEGKNRHEIAERRLFARMLRKSGRTETGSGIHPSAET